MKTILTSLFVCFLFQPLLIKGQSDNYFSLWNDPEVEQKINRGIQENRKGFATLIFKDVEGKTIENASVTIKQISHDFLFGANIFMFDGFDDESKNQRYNSMFTDLLNYASLPFYWAALEPEPGNLRFEAGSEPIYRRPPPDPIVKFCKTNNVTMKGHTLIWDSPNWSVPEWLPEVPSQISPLINNRITQIADHYGDDIMIWDVANEVIARKPHVIMPKDFALSAFQQSEKVFPLHATLILNETTTHSWRNFKGEYSPFYMLIDNLLMRGTKIDAIGFQFHFFSEKLHQDVLDGKEMQPLHMWEVMDRYSDFELPIHITEITIPALPYNEEGLKSQAELTKDFYRLWFAHPNVEAITWWNVADGTAVPGEDKWHGGFLDNDLNPKPAYEVLNQLINEEWNTQLTKEVNGPLKFQGFYGKYLIRGDYNGQEFEKEIHLSKNGQTEFIIQL